MKQPSHHDRGRIFEKDAGDQRREISAGELMTRRTFEMPYDVVPTLPELTVGALRIYIAICSRIGAGVHQAALSAKALAELSGFSIRSAFSAVAQLLEAGLIIRKSSRGKAGNCYALSYSPCGVHGEANDPQAPTAGRPSPVDAIKPEAGPAALPGGGDSDAEALDELIAKAYSAKCTAAQLQSYLPVDPKELRACLCELLAAGGVGESSPVGFLLRCVEVIHGKRTRAGADAAGAMLNDANATPATFSGQTPERR